MRLIIHCNLLEAHREYGHAWSCTNLKMIWFNNKQKIIFFFSEMTFMISFLLYCAPALIFYPSLRCGIMYCIVFTFSMLKRIKQWEAHVIENEMWFIISLLSILLLNDWIDRRFAHGTLWGEKIRSKTRTMEPSIDGKYCAYDRSK